MDRIVLVYVDSFFKVLKDMGRYEDVILNFIKMLLLFLVYCEIRYILFLFLC